MNTVAVTSTFLLDVLELLHGSPNKFNVLDQWKVSMNVMNVFWSVAFKA